MSNQLATTTGDGVIEALVLSGDLSQMKPHQKVSYYLQFCQSLGMNPITQPFKILKFREGKEVLYATKDATEQLRKIHGISVIELNNDLQPGSTYVVTCKVKDKDGKTDISTGAVSIENLKGENLANALMKAETKAKRRATLSICGLGMLDESEIHSIEGDAVVMDIPILKKNSITENAFAKAMERIKGGETDIIQKLREECILSEAQSKALLSFEDTNVPA